MGFNQPLDMRTTFKTKKQIENEILIHIITISCELSNLEKESLSKVRR